jgi:hypothetical protein
MAAPTSVPIAPPAEVPGYAKIAGILGIILAIVGVIVPVAGVLFITPLAVITGAIALYGHYKGIGIATLVINVVNLLISPTFWLNIGAGAKIAGAGSNRFLTYFDTIGIIVMFVLVVRKRK